MNGVRFHHEALEGQKTGAFLDQRENYAAAAQYARGEALDVFCYHGGFALHLAPHCAKVTGVDSSRPCAGGRRPAMPALNGREDRMDRGQRLRLACATTPAPVSNMTRSSSILPPLPRARAIWKPRCAATKSSICGL
jgi:hypothetical protein